MRIGQGIAEHKAASRGLPARPLARLAAARDWRARQRRYERATSGQECVPAPRLAGVWARSLTTHDEACRECASKEVAGQ